MEKKIEKNFTETFLEQPDLLELYSNEVVTIYGSTGTISDLAKMCPKDLRDPSITIEMKNEFVIKIANESGMTIDPEHETIFNKVLEEKGLERKFTVAEKPDKKATIESTNKTKPKTNADEISRMDSNKITHNEHILSKIIKPENNILPKNLIITEKLLKSPLELTEEPIPTTKGSLLLKKLVKYNNLVVTRPKNKKPETSSHKKQSAVTRPENNQQQCTSSKEKAREDQKIDTISNPASSSRVESLNHESFKEIDIASLDFKDIEDTFNQEEVESTYDFNNTEDAMTMESEKIYNDFIEILNNLLLPNSLEDSELLPESISYNLDIKEEMVLETSEQQPSITTIVADRLKELKNEDKEIVSIIDDIKLLENQIADPEKIAEIKVQLKLMITELFELIGINNEEEITRFLEVILKSNFNPTKNNTSEETVDLEYNGTREAKTKMHLNYRASTENNKLHQIIGMIVLLWSQISYSLSS